MHTIAKKKWLFYLLSFTWGLPLTLCGMIVMFVLNCFAFKNVYKWNYCWYCNLGHNWGGLEFGPFFLKDHETGTHTMNHESGHGVQNCVFGPLMIPVVCIPSAIRYWVRKIRKKKGVSLPDYDSIWFEGQATRLGCEINDYLNRGVN